MLDSPEDGVSAAIGSVAFGREPDFTVGVEEELLVVDARTLRLSHTGVELLERMAVEGGVGFAHPDTYSALVELASPVSATVGEAMGALERLRERLRAAGGTALGAGLHPDGAFGDVRHVAEQRYREIVAQLQGLIGRTPTCALHVHVGMPDAETAIRVCNGLREHLPLLQALAANSPFWHGRDSGLASARAPYFRAYRSADVPRVFAGYDDYVQTVEAAVAAGDLADYTFLWWDVRPHPRLGTVEVRAMDAQGALWSAGALAALVHALALRAAEVPVPATPREALAEASFCAARDGLRARLPLDGPLRPATLVARETVELARPFARRLGTEEALEGVGRILEEGNGADRQRAAYDRGGMPALLALLARETSAPYG